MTKVHDREQLIDAAARIFSEKGFEATRLEDIAAELGLLKGSLYYHVSSKNELLYLVLKRIYEPLAEAVGPIRASHATAREKLTNAIRVHLEHYDVLSFETSIIFSDAALKPLEGEHQDVLRDIFHGYEASIRGIIEEGITNGEFRDDLNVSIVIMALLGTCNWLPRWYRSGGRLSIGEIGDAFTAMLLDGIDATSIHEGMLSVPAADGTREPELTPGDIPSAHRDGKTPPRRTAPGGRRSRPSDAGRSNGRAGTGA